MDTNTILATGAVAILSALVGALVPGLLSVFADWRARRAARFEVVADLAGELLEGCERYRASRKDIVVMDVLTELRTEGITAPRSEVTRQRDDDRARLRSLQVRIGARHKKLGESSRRLIEAAIKDGEWGATRNQFMDDLNGTIG